MFNRLRTACFFLMLATIVTIGFVPNESDAGRRWHRQRKPVKRQNFPTHGSYKHSYYNHYYPKYIGGFNARYFDSIGVPSGDVGLRGNGIYMTPW